MSRPARMYVVVVMVLLLLGAAVRPSRAFFGLDPASWIVVGQMASVVSNLMAMRDTMMRIRDEALSSYRGLVDPIDDFAGQMRRALGQGASIDFSAFGGTDPRSLELAECASLPAGELGATPCVPEALPAAGTVYADLPGIDSVAAEALEEWHAIRAADFELELAEADHRDQLAEEALVAIALYLGCGRTQADADSRGVVVCPASRTWTADEREGLRRKLAESVEALGTADCPARGDGGAGQGVCASRAQHRSLLIAAGQAQANIDALLLKLDAEEADRVRRAEERALVEEGRQEQLRLDRLEALASLDVSLDTPAGRAYVLTPELHARNADAVPFGQGLFVGRGGGS